MTGARTNYWLGIIVGLVVLAWCAADATAQQRPGGFRPGGFGGGPGPMPGFGGGPLDLLGREDVRKELELVDEQLQQLEGLREKLRDQMREAFSGFRGGEDREGARDQIRERMEKINAEVIAKVDGILLPHQSTRLKQLSIQLRMRGGGAMGALGSPELAEQLGISEAQREQLRGKSQEVEQEFRRQMAELRRKAQDQLLALLTPQQRKQFDELVGEPFEFRDEPPRFGPPPGEGNARGQRGQRPERPNN